MLSDRLNVRQRNITVCHICINGLIFFGRLRSLRRSFHYVTSMAPVERVTSTLFRTQFLISLWEIHTALLGVKAHLCTQNIKCVEGKRVLVWNTATSGSDSRILILGFQALTCSLPLKGSWGFLLSFPLVIIH